VLEQYRYSEALPGYDHADDYQQVRQGGDAGQDDPVGVAGIHTFFCYTSPHTIANGRLTARE
jgi:hypothetical protein